MQESTKKPVAIAVFAHKPNLDETESLSLSQCWRILGSHPIFLVCPIDMEVSSYQALAPGLKVQRIDPLYLSSVTSYNQLKIAPFLYELFADYEYLLTYELDAFVFRDDLLKWCEADWDFIGAPIFEGFGRADPDAHPTKLRNSGFSLRRISSAARILHTFRLIEPISDRFRQWREHGTISPGSLFLLLRMCLTSNLFHHRFNGFLGHEDVFWTSKVPRAFPWYKVADYESARAFSFEALPERLFNERHHQLPFGCHKWHGYASEFWKPHISQLKNSIR